MQTIIVQRQTSCTLIIASNLTLQLDSTCVGPTQKYDENILLVKTPNVRQNLVCYQDKMIDDLSGKAWTLGVCQ